MDAQQRDLLPVPYFHVVFTVPAELHALFLAAPKATYSLLFAAVAETLTQVARRRLGAQIAVTAILHTWTQLLLFHPHIHCIVPGGGLDPGHTHWIAARADFFLPVRVLAEVSAARPARSLRAHPPLWLAGQHRAQAAPTHGARSAGVVDPRCPHAPARRARNVGGHVAPTDG
jgi:hypothetical protein